PHASSDELERPRLDLLPGAGDADDDRLAPSTMAALERLPHEVDIADALERVVGAALRQLDDVRDEVALHILRIHEVGHAHLAAESFARGIDVDADDHVRADHARA